MNVGQQQKKKCKQAFGQKTKSFSLQAISNQRVACCCSFAAIYVVVNGEEVYLCVCANVCVCERDAGEGSISPLMQMEDS